MSGRTLNLNVGGSARRRLVTAYREKALFAAVCLEKRATASPKQLRLLGADAKVGAILFNNHYRWFERLNKGVYALSAKDRQALQEYRELADAIRSKLPEA